MTYQIPEPRCMLCDEPVTAADKWKRWRPGIAHAACVRREKRKAAGGTVSEEVGVAVECKVCGLRKKPIGRAAPLEMANSMCDSDCPGYRQDPYPGELWPGETREEFGY